LFNQRVRANARCASLALEVVTWFERLVAEFACVLAFVCVGMLAAQELAIVDTA
jgi:hypothetical protein